MSIPPPSQSTAIIGHDEAKKQLQESYDSSRMHHAWLLVGPEGIGKATLAYHLAHMILSDGENRFGRFNAEHQAARLIAVESHPDLFVLRRPVDEKTGLRKETISVDDARKLAPFLSLTSSYGKGRVAIIDEAHALNRNGQNAILKVIEEPPTGATIIVTATTIGTLLPTIRSRCRVLKMNALPSAQLEVVLSRLGIDIPPDIGKTRLLKLAGGSVGKALRLIETEALPLYDELLSILSALPQIDLVKVHKLADKIGKKADSDAFYVVTDLLTDTLQDAVLCAATGRTDQTGLASKWMAGGRLDKAVQLWESVRTAFAVTDSSNLDRKLAFINVISQMSRETV